MACYRDSFTLLGPIEGKHNQIFEKFAPSLSATCFILRQTSSRQPCGREILHVERDLRYGDFESYLMLKIGPIDFLITT
jgi:hypothetical protein